MTGPVKQRWHELRDQLDRAYPACCLVQVGNFLEDHSPWAAAYFEYADILRGFCRFEEARRALRVASVLTAGPHAVLKIAQGRTYFDAGRLGLARRHFFTAVELAPRATEPRLWLARCWRRQGLVNAAETCLRQIRRRAGDLQGEVALELGFVLRTREKWGQASRWLKRAAEEGEVREAQVALADLHEARQVCKWSRHDLQYRDGGPVTELAAGRRLGKLEPDWVSPIARQATSLAELDRRREALLQVNHYQKLMKGHPAGQCLKAQVLDACGRYARAAQLHLKIASPTKDTGPWIFAGSCLARLGELERAEWCHRQATLCSEGNPDEAWYNLALVLRAQERYAEALECANQAAQIDPQYDNSVVQDLQKAVELTGERMRERIRGSARAGKFCLLPKRRP